MCGEIVASPHRMIQMTSVLRTVTLASLLLAGALGAQGWSVLPNGELGYSHNLTTAGRFGCGQYYAAGSGCLASGNSVTLFTPASSMTITFTASTQTVVATNSRDVDLVMGTLTKTFTGAPFTVPAMLNPKHLVFSFSLLLSSTLPMATTGRLSWGYSAQTGTAFPYDYAISFSDYVQLGVTPPPSPYTYSSMVYDTFRGLDVTFDTTPQTITGRVGIIPEPATTVLLGTGVVVLGVVARGRRTSGG